MCWIYARNTQHTLLLALLVLSASFSLFASTASAAPAAPQDTIITNCANDTQLNNAVTMSGDNTITFDCGTATIPISAGMEVADTIVIDGAGKITLDGGGVQAFFQVFAAARLTLRNLSLQNGRFNTIHPLENFGRLTLENVRIQGNSSNGDGGAIQNLGTLHVSDTIFISNTVTSAAGKGGALFDDSGNATIQNSTFISNSAPNGGAVYLSAGSAFTATFSTFADNSAQTGDGGAINCNNTKNVGVRSSTFVGNSAGVNGGAIFSTCDVDLRNITLHDNQALNGGGGGIYQAGNNVSLSVTLATITNNRALFGAGVYNEGMAAGKLFLWQTLLSDNTLNAGGNANCDGVLESVGYNLSSDGNCAALTAIGDQQNVDILLGPLANNGGPTQTRLPQQGSPAIDLIPVATCAWNKDQRDISRPQGTMCDAGAVEVEPLLYLYLPSLRNN